MKKMIKAASDQTIIKCIYAEGMDTVEPVLRSITVKGTGDFKQVIMDFVDGYLNLPYLGLDFNEPDGFTAEDIIERITYLNGEDVECDYIFSLEINGKSYIHNVAETEYTTI